MPLLPVLMLCAFVSAFTIRMIDPLVPAIARDFAVPIETAALLASAYTFPYAFAQPLLGPLADSIGKARMIKVCLACMSVCLFLGGIAARFDHLLLARALTGFAGGGVIPVAFALIGDRFPGDARQIALSRLVMASQIAILFGSALGGIVAERVGWRAMFVWPAAITGVAFLIALRTLPAPAPVSRRPLRLAGMRSAYAEALRHPFATIALVSVFCGGLVMMGLMPYVAARLEQRGLGGLDEAGLVIGAYSVGGIAFTLLVGRLLRWLGRGGMVRAGGCLSFAGLLVFAWSPSWPVEAAAFVVVGAGYFMVHNSLQAIGTDLAPDNRASGVALFAFVFFVGQALGPLLYGVLFHRFGPVVPVLLCAAVLFVIAMVLGARLDRSIAAATRASGPTAAG
jgi:predicted MFS family arabinose efflux permease